MTVSLSQIVLPLFPRWRSIFPLLRRCLPASGWFRRDGDYRAEYPLPIFVGGWYGGDGVGGVLVTLCRPGASEPCRLCARYPFKRRDNRSAEAGLKDSCWAHSAIGDFAYGISPLYGFTGTTLFAGVAEGLLAILIPGNTCGHLSFRLPFLSLFP